MMTDINFVIPISGYTGFPVDRIVEALLSGSNVDDVCTSFQRLSGDDIYGDEPGFFYDYLRGLLQRYPELLSSVNALRDDNGKNKIEFHVESLT